jgi:hypothetical protein
MLHIHRNFKKYSNKLSDSENFIMASMYTWHVSSRWYTSDLCRVAIDIEGFVALWHQILYPGIGDTGTNIYLCQHLLQFVYQQGAC